jgi:hypothetical protein
MSAAGSLSVINAGPPAHRTVMRTPLLFPVLPLLALVACAACSGSTGQGFFNLGDAGDGGPVFRSNDGSPGPGSGGDGGVKLGQADTGAPGGGEAGTTVVTIYGNTDTALYSLDPMTHDVALIGQFSGFSGGTDDDSATDCAVNAAGDVYVNSESVVYKATLPTAAGTVVLTKVASIALASKQKFYALAFAPAGVLGAAETLVGGDGSGELWSIDTTSGATRDLGGFGSDPDDTNDILALSGDIVFYSVAGTPTGIATIRSCESSGSDCSTKSDYLAGIDMTALAAAYASGTPASSLLAGIYGGASGSTGNGTGYGELFGLGVWEGTVFGFGNALDSNPPSLVSINTSTGVGSLISDSFGFSTGGWSGAGVSTTTTVTIGAPPPIK